MTSSGSVVSAKVVKPPEVADSDGDFATMALEEGVVARADDEVRELRGKEPAEPAHPFEFLDLRRHAFLELAVPLR